MQVKTNWGKTEALDAANLNRIESNIQELTQTKADGVTYANLQLQLTAQGVPIGTPVIVGGQQTFLNAFFSGLSVGSYKATTNVTSFPIAQLTSTKTAFIIHKNQFLVPGQEFTLDYQANRAVLTYALQAGETVHYILFGTSFSYNDLLGKPTVINNLTTPDLTENTVLDARQGRILKQAIDDLAQTIIEYTTQKDAKLEQLEFAISTKVQLNGISGLEQNLNFIGNKIEQSGLVANIRNNNIGTSNKPYIDLQSISLNGNEITFILKGQMLDGNQILTISDTLERYRLEYNQDKSLVLAYYDAEGVRSFANSSISQKINPNDINLVIILSKTGEVKIFSEGELYINFKNNYVDFTSFKRLYPFNRVDPSNFTQSKSITVIYNRLLTPQEIQHNFTVINNAESLNALDVGGKKLLLSTDSNHVEMATGRTLEEDYTALLKQHGKEFTSSGSAITVSNGIKGKVLNGEIKGQTVKNECYNGDFSNGESGFSFSNISRTVKNNTLTATTTTTGQPNFLGGNFGQKYSSGDKILLMAKIKCYQDCEALKLVLRDTTSNINLTCATENLPKAGQTYTLSGSTALKVASEFPRLQIVFVDNAKTGNVFDVSELVMINITNNEAIVDKVKGGLKFGLNSTQAVINNNGSLYPIYEPTIQGKTRILKAPKGTQNWVEIQADEVRDTATYDYKLDSINGNLGSVPSVADYIDRARKVKVANTKEITFNGSENWLNTGSMMYINGFGGYSPTTTEVACYSSVLPCDNNNGTIGHFYIHTNGNLQYKFLVGETFEQAKTKILNSKLRYRIASQEIQLTDEELRAYDAYKKVILCHGVGDVADNFEIKEDGSGLWTKKTSVRTVTERDTWAVDDVNNPNLTKVMNFICTSRHDKLSSTSVMCDILNYANKTTDIEGIDIVSSHLCYVKIEKTKLETQDLNGFLKWIKLNPITFRYPLATPIVTTIPKELMPTILTTDKINICQVESAVAPHTFKLSLPVDRLSELEARLTALEVK